jgi:predicted metalloendopeptidase
MKRVDAILLAAPMDTIRSYLKLHVIQAAARALPGPIRDTFYGFYFKNLYGMTEIPPHWRRCVDATEEFMPFALGRSYVAMNYKGESKTDTQKLINNIEAQMSALLDRSTWMDAATRKRAHEKLDRMVNQIGYPDHWRSYDDLKVGKSYVENRFNAIAFENTYQFNKIGKPVDRTEWYFGPTTVNAGYDPSNNRMQFPAGILQSPMFSAQFPDVANYAAIGVVMGHELSHGFDDDGSQFDANGVMTDWWTPSVHEEFKRRGECLAKQFDRFPTEGLGHVNGNLTLGEDIGDQGGIKLSYAAWKSTLKGEPSAEDSKKFFLAFAQSWCDKMTPAMEKTMVNTDPHPPARYRVRGGLMNFPEFAKVYQCKEGSEMAPKVRCEVW